VPLEPFGVLAAALLLAACGPAGAAPSGDPAPRPAAAQARYHATVPTPVASDGDVEAEALSGARAFLQSRIGRTGGAPRPSSGAPTLPVYVFRATVGEMDPDASGRTRAAVTVVVEEAAGGRVVGAMSASATAFVERTAPLAARQQRAIEGALEGALRSLPRLLDHLESGSR